MKYFLNHLFNLGSQEKVQTAIDIFDGELDMCVDLGDCGFTVSASPQSTSSIAISWTEDSTVDFETIGQYICQLAKEFDMSGIEIIEVGYGSDDGDHPNGGAMIFVDLTKRHYAIVDTEAMKTSLLDGLITIADFPVCISDGEGNDVSSNTMPIALTSVEVDLIEKLRNFFQLHPNIPTDKKDSHISVEFIDTGKPRNPLRLYGQSVGSEYTVMSEQVGKELAEEEKLLSEVWAVHSGNVTGSVTGSIDCEGTPVGRDSQQQHIHIRTVRPTGGITEPSTDILASITEHADLSKYAGGLEFHHSGENPCYAYINHTSPEEAAAFGKKFIEGSPEAIRFPISLSSTVEKIRANIDSQTAQMYEAVNDLFKDKEISFSPGSTPEEVMKPHMEAIWKMAEYLIRSNNINFATGVYPETEKVSKDQAIENFIKYLVDPTQLDVTTTVIEQLKDRQTLVSQAKTENLFYDGSGVPQNLVNPIDMAKAFTFDKKVSIIPQVDGEGNIDNLPPTSVTNNACVEIDFGQAGHRPNTIAEECQQGNHTWPRGEGKLHPDTKCIWCGELYGDPT